MASYNGGSDSDEESSRVDEFLVQSGSQMQLAPRPPEEIRPDTEENVEQETEELFQNFVYQQYRNEIVQQPYNNNPVAPALLNFPRVPNTPAAAIGRQLARAGDDINEKYKETFNRMISRLGVGPDTAYEAFAGVAKRLFQDGVNWGRIVALLCFGFRMAMQVLKQHTARFAEFLGRICKYVLQFLVTERISRWIAEHGGWRAALTFTPSVDTSVIVTILTMAAVSVVAVVLWNRYAV